MLGFLKTGEKAEINDKKKERKGIAKKLWKLIILTNPAQILYMIFKPLPF
jgi:hypothetical protein